MGESNAPRWRFPRLPPSHVNQDPVQGEFFTSSSDLPQRLVREAIQNSLDARADTAPVRVRFVFSGVENAISRDRASRYLAGLKEHIAALPTAAAGGEGGGKRKQETDAIESALARLDQAMSFLAIEDFGTTGLTGDIRDNPERAAGNDFWGFFRSVGISTKSEDAGGSWGLGKWVFPDASIINAYYGLTSRPGEDNYLLMGMALLKTHSVAGDKFPPYGYFAAPSEEKDDKWLPLPIDSDRDPDGILNALDDLGLKRFEGPGLSVILPFPKPELTPDSIARAVITQYFLPIVSGDLAVDILSPSADLSTEISSTTIGQVVLGLSTPAGEEQHRDDETAQSLSRAVELSAWAIRQSDEDRCRVSVSLRKTALSSGESLDDLRDRFERGARLAFQCTIPSGVERQTTSTKHKAEFRVYIERDDALDKGHDYFVRGHLRIPRMDHIGDHPARALIHVAGDNELAHLLRDSEGPAHAKWDPHARRLKEGWTGGYDRVQTVRRAAVFLLQLLSKRESDLQLDALADLFPGPEDPTSTRSSGSRPGTRPPHPLPLRHVPPPPIRVFDRKDGFVIRPNGEHAPREGTVLVVRVAYDVARGNPFTTYRSGLDAGTPDFSLDDDTIEIEPRNCEVSISGQNALRATLAPSFELVVRGFDGRDLVLEWEIEPSAATVRPE